MTVAAAMPPESGFEPEIRTAAGVLSGRMEAGLAVFRGITYAEPPVGGLRFAAPKAVSAWTGVRPAYSFGPQPPQPAFGTDASGQEPSSDDWLTLNVWSPDPAPGAGLPVLVWIPGGAYVIGASSFPEFDGARLASGGVVVVTLNYRLGAGPGRAGSGPRSRFLPSASVRFVPNGDIAETLPRARASTPT